MSRKNASAICILVAAIWGGGFIATDAALATFDPFTVLLIRFLGASLVCWLIVGIQKNTHYQSRCIKRGFIRYFLVFGLCLSNLWFRYDQYRSKCFFNGGQCGHGTLYRLAHL